MHIFEMALALNRFIHQLRKHLPNQSPLLLLAPSCRKVVDANHRERWVSNNVYWDLRKNPGFINMEPTVNLW